MSKSNTPKQFLEFNHCMVAGCICQFFVIKDPNNNEENLYLTFVSPENHKELFAICFCGHAGREHCIVRRALNSTSQSFNEPTTGASLASSTPILDVVAASNNANTAVVVAGASSNSSFATTLSSKIMQHVASTNNSGCKQIKSAVSTFAERLAEARTEVFNKYNKQSTATKESQNTSLSLTTFSSIPPSKGEKDFIIKTIMVIRFEEIKNFPKRDSVHYKRKVIAKSASNELHEDKVLYRNTYKQQLSTISGLKEFMLAKFAKGDDGKFALILLAHYSNLYNFPSFDIFDGLYEKKEYVFIVAPVSKQLYDCLPFCILHCVQ